MATKLGQMISYDNDDLHRGQKSTEVKYVNLLYGYHIWLNIPLIQGKDHDDLHEGHPKVIRDQIVNHAIWLSDFVRRTTEQNWGQLCPQKRSMLTEVKCSKVCFTIRSLGLKHHQAIKTVTALKRMLPPCEGTVMSCFSFLFCLFVCLFFFPFILFLQRK